MTVLDQSCANCVRGLVNGNVSSGAGFFLDAAASAILGRSPTCISAPATMFGGRSHARPTGSLETVPAFLRAGGRAQPIRRES
jgi:hypothetical protein